MGVIRVERNKNFTHMANYHLRDRDLSLRAVGLMSKMLSLPEDWDYTVAGLASICKEGREAVRKTLQELEAAGYLVRQQGRAGGKFAGADDVLFEKPDTCPPMPGNLGNGEAPMPGKPVTGNPVTDIPPQVSINNQVRKDPPIAPQGASVSASTPKWKPERFEAFWRYYPAIPDGNGRGRRPAKDRAARAWDKLHADDSEIDLMAAALQRQKASRQWRDGVGIPYASTWLNSHAWRDEVEDLRDPSSAEPPREEALPWI